MKNRWYLIPVLFLIAACSSGSGTSSNRLPGDTVVAGTPQESELSVKLSGIVPQTILQQDSAAVMILPLINCCPSCRDKVIKSIMVFRKKMPPKHYIVLSADASMKTMQSYFIGAGYRHMPEIPGVIIIDSTDESGKLHLYHDNPAFYYLSGGKVYRKINALPHTVKEDLREYFRGKRKKEE